MAAGHYAGSYVALAHIMSTRATLYCGYRHTAVGGGGRMTQYPGRVETIRAMKMRRRKILVVLMLALYVVSVGAGAGAGEGAGAGAVSSTKILESHDT